MRDSLPIILNMNNFNAGAWTSEGELQWLSIPLSAFQALAICLSSFDTKAACE